MFNKKNLWNYRAYITAVNVSFLLFLKDLEWFEMYYNNIEEELFHNKSDESITVTRVHNHSFVNWNPEVQCAFTKSSLQRLQLCFDHSRAVELHILRRRRKLEHVDRSTRG